MEKARLHRCSLEATLLFSNALLSSQGPCRTALAPGNQLPVPLPLRKVSVEMQAALYSQEPQSPLVFRRLQGGAKLPVIATLFLQEGEGTHFSNKQRREKINKDVCNEFLFPEIARQEPCQEELGLISCKMRDTNPRTLFRSAAPLGSRMSATGLVGM